MSRVANNLPPMRYTNGAGQPTKSTLGRSSSTSSNGNNIGVIERRVFNVRSAAPASAQKETVHACPLCNSEYKDPRVLPCTHTYCFNCIRDKLINNSRLTCPKCHYQAHPFDEIQLQELPPNLILSQEWRIGARLTPSVPPLKKSMAYQPTVPSSVSSSTMNLPQQTAAQGSEKRRSIVVEYVPREIPLTNDTNLNGIASIVNAFNRTSTNGENENRTSRSSSISSIQPLVSNLIKIYSEATPVKTQRIEDTVSTDKHNELIKIFEQETTGQQQVRSASPMNIKQATHACDEITWDNLVHGTTPVVPSSSNQPQSAVENYHHPREEPERSVSVSSLNIENLREIVFSIQQQHQQQQSSEKPSTQQSTSFVDTQLSSRLSGSYRLQDVEDDDEDDIIEQIARKNHLHRQHVRQTSNTESIHSGHSDTVSRRSPIPPIIDNVQPRLSISSVHDQEDDKVSQRTTPPSRHSSDRFPPPPSQQQIDTQGSSSPSSLTKPRATSSISYRSSIHEDQHEQLVTPEIKIQRTERFNLNENNSPVFYRNNSSQAGSYSSTPTYRPSSMSNEHDEHIPQQRENYLSPTSPLLVPSVVSSRVETLLSDQKRLEREIEEQIRRLSYDYDDVRTQIDRKRSAIQTEVKNIATRLDDDITENYHRKQRIYADLAVDTNTVGTELERLRASTNNNKQLWDNLEQIESNIRNIRQAVEEQKEPYSALTFAEGRRAIGSDAIGQITSNGFESHRKHSLSTSSPLPSLEQPISSLTPYKYVKIDHLSTLEPEAIAITENKKTILLGICNKLFILNEFGDILKTIQLKPSIRGIAVSKKPQTYHIAYISHDEIVTMINTDTGEILDCVKETDSADDSGTFLPLGIDTDSINGCVYVCDYRNSCVIKFDDKLEFITQWRIYNHSDQYDEARPKLISIYGQRLYMIVEHSCKPYYNQGIAYTFSLHICDINSGNIIRIIDAKLLSTQRLRWPCSIHAISNNECYVLDTMTSGKYFNGQWQKHWSRVLDIRPDDANIVKELFQLDSEAATMALTKQTMIISANGEILFVDLAFIQQELQENDHENSYQN
ncbi:unnamed protein product [Adineta ricciae]|uniref:RING-type domain-containing protein n=2 Tax=Adineta ricciae TaxID=249248 RepID=A0A814CDC1_ADIRI|nr:unnamed protein product [Adineta ricciae]